MNERMKEWLNVKKIVRNIQVTERRERRSKQLLCFLLVTRVHRKMKEESLAAVQRKLFRKKDYVTIIIMMMI